MDFIQGKGSHHGRLSTGAPEGLEIGIVTAGHMCTVLFHDSSFGTDFP